MDGTSRAAHQVYIVPPEEHTQSYLEYKNEMELFQFYCKLAKNMHRQGLLRKRWLVIPVFVNGSHWAFYAFLHLTSLCEEQSKTFSAYFKYDSGSKMVTQDMDFAQLDKYGVTSFLVYIVHRYGTPKPANIDIRSLLLDPNRLPKIHLYAEDNIQQDDNNDCGVFCIMSMVHFCCSTSHLVKGSADLATYRRKYYLPRGHWLSMFKLTLSNTIDKSFRNKVRDQLTTFFERLDFMRDQVMVQDPNAKFPKVENPMAGDYLTSFRREGWGLTNPSSVAATVFTRIKERRKAKLPLLFQCANNEFFFPKATVPFISAPITNEEMSDAEEESVYLAAGMMDTADREAIRQETMDSQEQLLEDLHGAEFDQTTQQPEEERALPHSEQQVPQPPQDQQEQPPQDQLAQPLPNVQQQQQQQNLQQQAIMEMESEVLDSATTEKFVVEDREEGEVSEAEEKDHEKEGEVSKVDKEDHEEGEVSEVEEGTHEKEGMKKSEEGKKSDEEEDSSEEEEDSSDEEEEEASSEEEEDNSAVEGDNGEEEKDEVSEAEEDHEGGKRSDEEEDSSEEEEDGSDEEEDISEEEEGEEQQTGRFPLQASLKVLPSSRLKAARREMDQNISGLSNIKLTDSLLSYDKVADKEDRKTCKKLLETKFPKIFSLPLFEGGKWQQKISRKLLKNSIGRGYGFFCD